QSCREQGVRVRKVRRFLSARRRNQGDDAEFRMIDVVSLVATHAARLTNHVALGRCLGWREGQIERQVQVTPAGEGDFAAESARSRHEIVDGDRRRSKPWKGRLRPPEMSKRSVVAASSQCSLERAELHSLWRKSREGITGAWYGRDARVERRNVVRRDIQALVSLQLEIPQFLGGICRQVLEDQDFNIVRRLIARRLLCFGRAQPSGNQDRKSVV